jgi:hypothetical protein
VRAEPRRRPNNPVARAAAPPIIIHIALSVGDPVKMETSEVNDSEALIEDQEECANDQENY